MENTSTTGLLKSLQDLYANGEYDKGISLLIENKDKFDAAQFHYNLGTFYAKSGQYAAGRYNLEKSIREGAVGSEVFHNLRNVKKQLEVQDLGNSPFIGDRVKDFTLSLSGDAWLFVTLTMIVAVLLMLKTKVLKANILAAILIALSFVPVGYKVFYLNSFTYGVALKNTSIHEGPSEIFDGAKTLVAGSKVIIGKIKPGWLYISNPIDASGWVKNKTIAFY